MKNKIICLCGCSGAGKDSISKEIINKYNYKFAISYTTRPPRSGEKNLVNYIFIDSTTFKTMNDKHEFIDPREYRTSVNGIWDTWYYAHKKTDIDLSKHNYLVIVDINGLKAFKKEYGDNVISFFINVDESERTYRSIRRKSWDEDEWKRRLKDDDVKFSPQVIKDNCDFVVENYNLNMCVNEIINDIKQTESEEDT